jgi:hypothetical protein
MKKVLEAIQAALKALTESKATGARAESIEAHLKACASNAAAELTDGAKGFSLVHVLLAVAAIGLGTMAMLADSFQVTNQLASAVAIVNWPTNSPSTNGNPTSTGGAISVANQEWAGFYFSGYSTTNTNSTVTVTLVKGWGSTPTLYTYDATGTNVNGINFETVATITLAIPIVGSGVQGWSTNLDRTLIGPANWVGIYSVTNGNAGSNGNLTNVVMGLNKKIIPIRYP